MSSRPHNDRHSTKSCDVLVIGSGLAGLMAALHASFAGARVILTSSGPICSGASFHASTWGLGLVGPKNVSDEQDLATSIIQVGRGVAQPRLVESFVKGINPVIDELDCLGVDLAPPDNKDDLSYIPCFDTKPRRWRGVGRESFRTRFLKLLDTANVELLPYCELIELLGKEAVTGALLASSKGKEFIQINAHATVLATGGIAGLFENSLMGPYCQSTAQADALAHGAALTNIEFVQFMPTIISPVFGVVFNEKSFRYTSFPGSDDTSIRLLEERSGYGPFSASYDSSAIDIAIASAGEKGLEISYTRLPEKLPGFVKLYFSWLQEELGLLPDNHFRIKHFAHAANGGIRIDENASTGVAGLFAAGECSGGMHGANRIGGLASANALVFGARAGDAAASYALGQEAKHSPKQELPHTRIHPTASALAKRMKAAVSFSCMVVRNEKKLSWAEAELTSIEEELNAGTQTNAELSYAVARETMQTSKQLVLAQKLVRAARMRCESRGAHYREDFPEERPCAANNPSD